MDTPSICLTDFELHFMRDPYPRRSSNEDPDHEQVLERMESKVPKSATFLGMVEGDLDHSPGLFWKIEDRYYLLRLRRSSYKWALVRISWDDNWSRYQWSGNARGSGFADANHAARALVMAAFKNWGIDPESDEYAHYRNFVARLPNG